VILRSPPHPVSIAAASMVASGTLRRRAAMRYLAVGVFACALAPTSAAANPRPLIEPTGIGSVHFGIAKAQAVSELSRLLGKPSARFVDNGCGPRYTEAAWGHLYVEFRGGQFIGYRYIENGWPAKKQATSTLPLIATSKGITLGSTLGQVRAAYRRLALVGTDRWRANNGLIFYDNAEREPPPASSRIIEIKIGTCGDY
jgi:hypothetical protein